jgi:hypothetical protein
MYQLRPNLSALLGAIDSTCAPQPASPPALPPSLLAWFGPSFSLAFDSTAADLPENMPDLTRRQSASVRAHRYLPR